MLGVDAAPFNWVQYSEPIQNKRHYVQTLFDYRQTKPLEK